MTFIQKKQLARCTFLRGAGGVLALPLLDAMIPAFGKAAVAKSPTRMAIVYFPNGVQTESWIIPTTTASMPLPEKFPRTLEPLEVYRNDISVVGGLTVDGGRAKGDGPGDHGRAGAS